MSKEIKVGYYLADSGKEFDCVFYPEQKIAYAIEILSPAAKVSMGKERESVECENIEESKIKLNEILGPGKFRDKYDTV